MKHYIGSIAGRIITIRRELKQLESQRELLQQELDRLTSQPQPDPNLSISVLNLPKRIHNALTRSFTEFGEPPLTIADLLAMLERGEDHILGEDCILTARGFGDKGLDILLEKLDECGYLDTVLR